MQTTSFKIARYILIVFVLILCVGILAWILFSGNNNSNNQNENVNNVIRITNSDPCVQEVNNTIAQLWAYDINSVPQKYIDMIEEYTNEKISVKTTGYCNDVKFTCKPGQIRKDCDPCALGSAKQFAMDQQIVDMISIKCKQ